MLFLLSQTCERFCRISFTGFLAEDLFVFFTTVRHYTYFCLDKIHSISFCPFWIIHTRHRHGRRNTYASRHWSSHDIIPKFKRSSSSNGQQSDEVTDEIHSRKKRKVQIADDEDQWLLYMLCTWTLSFGFHQFHGASGSEWVYLSHSLCECRWNVIGCVTRPKDSQPPCTVRVQVHG